MWNVHNKSLFVLNISRDKNKICNRTTNLFKCLPFTDYCLLCTDFIHYFILTKRGFYSVWVMHRNEQASKWLLNDRVCFHSLWQHLTHTLFQCSLRGPCLAFDIYSKRILSPKAWFHNTHWSVAIHVVSKEWSSLDNETMEDYTAIM